MKNIFLKKCMLILLLLQISLQGISQRKSVLIAYHSVNGHTEQMANAILKGIKEHGEIIVNIKSVQDVSTQELNDASAIILGSPVYNANPSPEILSFIKSWPFEGQPLKNKLGAVFVTAGGFSSGEELVQSSLLHAMMVYGMIVVGGDDWTASFGASGIHQEGKYNSKEMDPHFLDKAFKLGMRVAEVLKMMN